MALLDAKRVRFKDRTSAKEIEDHQQDVDSGSDVVENEDDNNDADDSGGEIFNFKFDIISFICLNKCFVCF